VRCPPAKRRGGGKAAAHFHNRCDTLRRGASDVGSVLRGACQNHQVLITVSGPNVLNCEACPNEEVRKRSRAEIRAMLVVNIPKRTLFQNALDIRHLKKDKRIPAVRDGAYRSQKSMRWPDVLERHLATEEIRRDLARLLRKELPYEPNILF